VRFNHFLCAILAVAPGLSGARAQSAAAVAPRRLGVVAGINSSTVGGSDVGATSRRAGLTAGVLIVAPVGAKIAIEPEVLVTTKGAKFSDSQGSGSFTMKYVEVPVLVRYESVGAGGMRPFVFGGPAIALKASCDLEGTDAGLTVDIGCDEVEAQGLKFKSVDYGLIVGGGVAFDIGGRALSIGARYDHSLTEVAEGSNIKHRVISIVATFEVPWMR